MRKLCSPGTAQYDSQGPTMWAEATYQSWWCCMQPNSEGEKPEWVADHDQLKATANEMVELIPRYIPGHATQHAALDLRADACYHQGKPASLIDCMQARKDWRTAADVPNLAQVVRDSYLQQAGDAEKLYRTMIADARK